MGEKLKTLKDIDDHDDLVCGECGFDPKQSLSEISEKWKI